MTKSLRRLYIAVFLLLYPSPACRIDDSPQPPSRPPHVKAPPAAPDPVGEVPILWGDLVPGTHPVGYRQKIFHDAARAYTYPLAPYSQRPILLNIWYPAAPHDGQAMTVEDYLLIQGLIAAGDRHFADLLEQHVRAVFTEEILGREPQLLPRAVLARREQLTVQPVFARRDAEVSVGKFPLVLAHPGLGGAFADNFVLYEYLASHGYIVISSAFQSADGPFLNINWEPATSVADLDFLASWAHKNLNVDRVAVMGHSYGAQAALIYAMERRAIDAVVSLDSTFENGDPANPWYKDSERHRVWLDRAAEITVPTLLFSTPEGTDSSFFDALVKCDRRSLKVPALEHDDFESHGGVLQSGFAYDRRPPDPERPTAKQVGTAYRLVVRATLAFLDGILRKDARALTQLDTELPTQLRGVQLVHVPHQAAMTSATLLNTVRRDGVAAAVTECVATPSCDARLTLVETGDMLIKDDKSELALAMMQWVTTRYPTDWNAQRGRGDALLALHRVDEARVTYQRALTLLGQEYGPLTPFQDMKKSLLKRRLEQVNELVAAGG